MWKDFFSSIGIDSVKVDTKLKKRSAAPGETIHGEVFVTGGQAEEPIEKIQVLLYMQYEEVKEDSDFSWHDKDIEDVTIDFQRNIKTDEEINVPFSVTLPEGSHFTDDKHKWFIRTKVFVDQAVDPEDEDEIFVRST